MGHTHFGASTSRGRNALRGRSLRLSPSPHALRMGGTAFIPRHTLYDVIPSPARRRRAS